MRKPRFALYAIALLPLVATPAVAKDKPKAAANSKQLTQADLRVCTGVDASDPDLQIATCTKILNSGKVKHPFQADYLATRAAAYFAKKQYDLALADLNKAIDARKAPEFYVQRGLVQRARFEWDPAKTDLEKAIALKPEFAHAYFMRGIIAYELIEYHDALKFFEAAVQKAPANYSAIYARGVVKTKLGDVSGGKADIAKARGLSSKVDEIMAPLGIKA